MPLSPKLWIPKRPCEVLILRGVFFCVFYLDGERVNGKGKKESDTYGVGGVVGAGVGMAASTLSSVSASDSPTKT
jgi:hypothetical protein